MEHIPTHYNTDWKKFSGYPKEVETKEIKDIKQMTIEELFGTLQMSVVSGWRKHLRSAKYGKHQAMGEFYEEMPEKVDALIEAWMGAHGKKVGNFVNIISSANLNTLSYLKELKHVCKSGYSLMNDNEELKSLLDDIVNLINSTLYKVKELSESRMIDLKDFIAEALVNEKVGATAEELIRDMYDEDGEDLVSIASCFHWLVELDWEEMNLNQYAREIHKINRDISMEVAKDRYSEVMVMMADAGRDKTLEIIKSIINDPEELEDYDIE